MLIAIAGGVFALLGLACATLLVAAPLGWVAATTGTTLWVLFPLFTLLGYGLLVVGSRDPAVRLPTRVMAGLLLLAAVVAAIGLVAGAAGLWAVPGGSASLWYVLVLGGIVGAVGSAAGSSARG